MPLIRSHGPPDQYPARIAIDPNNNVLVTDYDAHCINIFTDKGQFIQTSQMKMQIYHLVEILELYNYPYLQHTTICCY